MNRRNLGLGSSIIVVATAIAFAVATFANIALAQDSQPASDQPTDESSLSLEQQSLAARFERLEAVASKLAELAAASEPERAKQLREAIRQSREMGTRERFSTIVELLRNEQLSAASRDQSELQSQLQKLLQVLLEDASDDGREKLKEQLRAQIREVNRMIRQQRSLRSQNQGGREAEEIADRQAELEAQAAKLEAELNGKDPKESKPSEGEPKETSPSEQAKPGESESSESQPSDAQSSESQPAESQPSESQPSESQPGQSQPSESQPGQSQPGESQPQENADQPPPSDAAQRIEAARQAMQEAEQKLREAERDKAADKQREAQRELEQARAELERILRQLREEEMEELLTQLAARFREMLALQRSIYDETVSIDSERVGANDRSLTLKAVKLSRREADLTKMADRALVLLREDGTSVAFTEALTQIREDMQTVVDKLAEPETGFLTQAIEEEIVAALEESVAALDLALDELAKQRSQQGQQQGEGGEPGEPPLVSKLAELKMIRTLQARINSRTKMFDRMIVQGSIERVEVRERLQELSDRQLRVFEATRDLDSGRNQ